VKDILMDTDAQLWDLLANAGIHVRETAGRAYGWEYAIPAIHRDWSGPYRTKGDALIAAVHYLIHRASEGQSEAPVAPAASPDQHQAASVAEQEALRKRLGILRVQAAAYGVNTPPTITREIKIIEERLAEIDNQTSQHAPANEPPTRTKPRPRARRTVKTSRQVPNGLPTDPARRRAMLLDEQTALQERLHSLRIKATRLGMAIDPVTIMEMEDTQQRLAEIGKQLRDATNAE
jgi:hypothetical protein